MFEAILKNVRDEKIFDSNYGRSYHWFSLANKGL